MIADTFEVGNLLQIFTEIIPTSILKFEGTKDKLFLSAKIKLVKFVIVVFYIVYE